MYYRRPPHHLVIALMAACSLLASPIPDVEAHPGGHDRIMTLNEQIAHEPGNAYLLIKRAQELIQEDKDYGPAKADLDKAHSLGATAGTSHEYSFVMGLWHQYQQQYDQASQFFKHCLNLDMNHLQCHRGLAETHLARNDQDKAIAVLKRFVELGTTAQTDDYFHLAQLLEKTNQPTAAVMYLDQAQARFGKLPHFEKYAITIEISQQRYEKALQRHQSLQPYFGKTPQWQYDQGVLFQNLGNTAQAKAAFQQALATLQQLKNKTSKANGALEKALNDKLAALN